MNTFHSLRRASGRLLLIGLIALACYSQANANTVEGVSVTATPSQTSLQVAEPFWLEFTLAAPAGAKVTFPSMGERLGEFDILDKQDRFDIPGTGAEDQRTWTRRLQLESIVTGELEVPPIEIQVTDANTSQVIRSQPVPVRIVSVMEERGDPTQFRDIQSVVDVAVPANPSRAWIGWTLAGFAALALAIAAAVVVTRRKQWLTPSQWAIQQLNELECASPNQESGAAASQLAAVMRNFLQLEFSLPEPGRTAEELLQVVQAKKFVDAATLEQVQNIFALADEAKFAGLSVSSRNLQAMIDRARSLVQRIADATDSQKSFTARATTEAR